MSYAIKHKNNTYFTKWTGVGPCFGGTPETAMRFASKRKALQEMGGHYGFVMADVVQLDDEQPAHGEQS